MTWRGALVALAMLFLIWMSYTSKRDWRRYLETAHLVEHTYKVMVTLEELRTSIEDAQANQRVYLLTGEERYLELYRAALPRIERNQTNILQLVADNPGQQERLDALNRVTAAKFIELQETIKLRREGKVEEALRVVRTDRDQKAIAEVRRITGDVREEEYRLLTRRSAQAEAQIIRTRRVGGLTGCVLILLLIMATIAIERDTKKRRRTEEALRDSEEQFRQVFEDSPSGILLMENDLRIRRANPAICRLLGYEETELQQLTLSAITPEDRVLNVEPCATHRQYCGKSGGTVWVNVNAAIIRNSEGRALYNLALIEDITARRKVEQEVRALNDSLELRVEQRTMELARTNRQLELANKELEAFAYSVSHDLRAPLRSVDGFSQIILEEYADKLDEDGARYLGRIRAGTKTMSQLIDDLLNLSRVSRTELQRVPVDLSSVASSILSEWRGREPWRAIDIEIVPEALANGDARLLRIALDNLLGNAWKFTSKGANASIEFGAMNHMDGTIYFVRDNGAGFDMAYASQLFNPFQRLHQGTEFEGTGIGLATVQRIVQSHGGRVWAEGSVGSGATFYFTLAGGADEQKEDGKRAC